VPLHSTELGAAIDQITLPATLKLTPEHAFIAQSMGTKLPLLPVHGKEENVLFHSLVLAAPQGPLNFDSMAIEWCKHVDGKAIFPKLPVYLRKHFADWERNQKLRKAVSGAAAQLARLEALNRHTVPASLPAPAPAPAASPPTRTIPAFIHPTPVLANAILPTSALLTSALLPTTVLANLILPISTFPTSAFPTSALTTSAILPPVCTAPSTIAGGQGGRSYSLMGAAERKGAAAVPWTAAPFGAQPVYHAQMPSAPFGMRAVSCAQLVGGVLIGAPQPAQPPAQLEQRRHGDRGPDMAQRAPRVCKSCMGASCPGKWRSSKCPLFVAPTE